MDHNLNDNQMGIKQREKIIDELRKENFGLKMRIYFLQQNIQNLTPEGMHTIVTEHTELKAVIEILKAGGHNLDLQAIKEMQNRIFYLESKIKEKSALNTQLQIELKNVNDKTSQSKKFQEMKLEIFKLNQTLLYYKRKGNRVKLSKSDAKLISNTIRIATEKLQLMENWCTNRKWIKIDTGSK